MVDPRGSGLLFFMFIRPQPYTCLGIEWLTHKRGSGLVSGLELFFMFIRPQPYTCLGIEWLTQGGVVYMYYFSCLYGPNTTPVREMNA